MNTTPNTTDKAERTKEAARNDSSLKASGIGYLIGDASMVASGILRKEYGEARGGALYGLGGLVLATCGNPSTEKRLHMLYQDMGKYLKDQGVTIPKGTHISREVLAQQGGIIDHVQRFLYTYPSHVLNGLFTIGGLEALRGGLKEHREGKSYGKYGVAAGAFVMGGALVGLLVNEHPAEGHQESKEHQSFLGKAKHWVQEKPLRLSGYLYMGNNVANSISAYKQFKADPTQHSYKFKILTVASYVVANHFLSKSSKDNLSFKEELGTKALYDLEMAAAEIIAVQPEKVRDGLIKQMAGYLSANSHTHIPVDDLAKGMHEMVEEFTHKAESKEWQNRVAPTLAGRDGAQPSL